MTGFKIDGDVLSGPPRACDPSRQGDFDQEDNKCAHGEIFPQLLAETGAGENIDNVINGIGVNDGNEIFKERKVSGRQLDEATLVRVAFDGKGNCFCFRSQQFFEIISLIIRDPELIQA